MARVETRCWADVVRALGVSEPLHQSSSSSDEEEAQTPPNYRTKECWFHVYAQHGCTVGDAECAFRHSGQAGRCALTTQGPRTNLTMRDRAQAHDDAQEAEWAGRSPLLLPCDRYVLNGHCERAECPYPHYMPRRFLCWRPV